MTPCFSQTLARRDLAGEAHQRWQESEALRIVLLGLHGQRSAERFWRATGLSWPPNDRNLRRRRVHDAWDGRSADSGRTKDTCDPHPTKQRVARLRKYRAAGSRLHSLWSGIQEPELRRGGRSNGREG